MSQFYNDWVYQTREELMDWVQNTAHALGYVIITQRTKKTVYGFVNKAFLMCDRGGVYKSTSDSTTHSGTKKTGCPFQLIAKYHEEDGGWKIHVVCDEHNHEPSKFLEGHAYAKRLSKEEYALVEDLTRKNMQPRDILTALKENNDKNVSTIETVYDARTKIRKMDKLGTTPMQALLHSLQMGGYIYDFTKDETNQLNDLFFVNPTSLKIWRAFPHVIILDCTYKTNRYRLPFLQIVGLTSTNKTFCIAFAFIRNEKKDNFKWALNCLRKTLDGYMVPRVIVTDRELALMDACQVIFPEATRLLCRYHIQENIRKHCRPSFKSQTEWDKFMYYWRFLLQSPTIEAYYENRTRLQTKLMSKHRIVFNYLDVNWLQNYKEMFVSAWIDQHLNFGERTTNRVESQHALLKKHLNSDKSNLDKFIGILNNIIRLQETQIKASFEESRIKIKHQHKHNLFVSLLSNVSHEALDILVGELTRVNEIQDQSQSCGCHIRTSCGLPCACEIARYLKAGKPIPLHSIDIFWRRLDFSPASLNEDEEDIQCDDELERFKDAYQKQKNPTVKKNWLERIKSIRDPISINLNEPTIQKNTRGRPTLKSQKQNKPDPSPSQPTRGHTYTTDDFVSYDFMGMSPPKHSSNVHNTTQSSLYHHPLLTQIPKLFHPYITHIENVNSDGNCGFRAVSFSLGFGEEYWLNMRYDLLNELHNNSNLYRTLFSSSYDETERSLSWLHPGPAPDQHWMIMPYTGLLIANRFNVILQCLSPTGSATYFPLWTGPDELMYHQFITIAHVYGCHYVSVRLEGEYPLPFITPLWNFHKSNSAAAWERIYEERLLRYSQYILQNKTVTHFNID